MARFSDNNHHVVEEAALPGAGFTPEQIHHLEQGNIQRDYSQIGKAGNAVLLGQAKSFGGYDPAEHFDNFIFDAVTDRWRTRGVGKKFQHLDPKTPDFSPIDYISKELTALATAGMTDDSLPHLGNAFHTIEDFFAHSNFIELLRGDVRFGKDLLTGSFNDDPANSDASLAHTLVGVSTPPMQQFYERQGDAATARTAPTSHSHIAKDTASSEGFTDARRLAARVIQDLGADIVVIMRNPNPQERAKLIGQNVVGKVRRYLRPPDPKDPWWTKLITGGGAAMDKRIAEAEKRTPVTVNQWLFSPLRNLEASKNSTMGIPFGAAVPVGGQAFFQLGGGITRSPMFDPRMPDPPPLGNEKSSLLVGAQLTGSF